MTPACANCGKNLTAADLRRTDCAYCGTLLPHASNVPASVQPMVAHYSQVGVQVKRRTPRAVIVAVVVLSLLVGGAGAFFLLR